MYLNKALTININILDHLINCILFFLYISRQLINDLSMLFFTAEQKSDFFQTDTTIEHNDC